MTFKKWQYELKCLLRGMPNNEIKEIARYYEEMYTDKREAGIPEDDILIEFGTPNECAERILSDTEIKNKENGKKGNRLPFGVSIVAMVFLTLLIILPVAAAMLSIVVSLGAGALSCAAVSLTGPYAILLGIYYLFSGMGTAPALALVGAGTCATPICLVLALGFWLATKYTAIYFYKAIAYIYRGRKGVK